MRSSCCRRRVSRGKVVCVALALGSLTALEVFTGILKPLWYGLFPRGPIDTRATLSWEGHWPHRGDPQWQRLDHQGEAFVYAAHYDDVESPPLIRVIALAEDPLSYFFVTCRYYVTDDGPAVAAVTGTLLHLQGYNGYRYMGAYVECPLGHVRPVAVSVDRGNQDNALNFMRVRYSRLATWSEHPPSPSSTQTHRENEAWEPTEKERGRGQRRRTSDGDSQPFLWNVTRCFPAFQMTYDDHVMLAEMVAISRLLGVEHFVFYVQRAGPRVLRMLKVLKAQGDVEVHPWNLNLAEGDVHYAGQFSSINDCLYRHLWTSRYLLFADVDELFVQRQLASLTDLLEEHFSQSEECGAFLFLNVFFNLRLPASTLPKVHGTQARHLDQLKMLTHTLRHIQALSPGYRSKLAVDPRKVKTGSVHDVETLRQGYTSCVISQDRGLLHHYRRFGVPDEDQLMEDPFLWGIFEDLLEEISYVLDQYEAVLESE